MLEEAYEVVDAIGTGVPDRLRDELGDVLMQVVFHADIAEAAGQFDFDDVVSGICRKLISRHTHVFGTDEALTASDVIDTWERNKLLEKGLKSTSSALREVTRSLPALTRSQKVQHKAAAVGFDWAEADGAAEKIVEELAEVREAAELPVQAPQRARLLEDEVGDLLFSVVNYARKLGVQPELALDRACEKFIRRFTRMEEAVTSAGASLVDMDLQSMDDWWERAKLLEGDSHENR
jgi:tetrapyrrole methylase family protein/MazG family protein